MALSEMSRCGRVDSGLGGLSTCCCLTRLHPGLSLTCHLLTIIASSIAISGVGVKDVERIRDWLRLGDGVWASGTLLGDEKVKV